MNPQNKSSLNPYVLIVLPIGSMYGTFASIYHKKQPNVGKCTSPMDPMGYSLPSGKPRLAGDPVLIENSPPQNDPPKTIKKKSQWHVTKTAYFKW